MPASNRWLLFTDADTLHEPGDLRRAICTRQRNITSRCCRTRRARSSHGLAQHTLMPLIFSELATVYPPSEVNDPARRIAAANGQFLLVAREAYFGAAAIAL